MIKSKSIYHDPSPEDGERFFVDRLWPEGVTTRGAALSAWLLELAPSYELWRFRFSPENWEEYRTLYRLELSQKMLRPLLRQLQEKSSKSTVTLLYGTPSESHNNAVALKEYLENLNDLRD